MKRQPHLRRPSNRKWHYVCTVCGERLPKRLGAKSYVEHIKKHHTATVYED